MFPKYVLLFVFFATIAIRAKAQLSPALATPNKFHGFSLGFPLSDFSLNNLKNSKGDLLILFSDIQTKSMKCYTLKDQLTEGGDKIDIDFFFYNDSLSVIRAGYKDRQTSKGLMEALKGKYGNDDRLEHDIYNDTTGATQIIENLYWEKSDCCILNLTSTDGIGLVYITFAEKAVQITLKAQELMDKQKRIN